MAVARLPQLGSKPVALTVKLKASKVVVADFLAIGLQEMYRKGEFADVVLKCAEKSFTAHRVVLASQSPYLKEGLSGQPPPGPNMRHEIRLEVDNPEAVEIMLDYLYNLLNEKHARTQDINRDVLQLAKQFDLPGLTEQAMIWLSKDLSTGNVIERLSICDDFGLSELSEKILEQLTMNKAALSEVANSEQIMKYPKLMQSILQCAASSGAEAEPQQQKNKKARRA